MKRIIAVIFLLLFLISSPAALAEGSQFATELSFSEELGYETHYRLFDTDIYEAECEKAGTVVKVKYKTSVYGKEMNRWANVYLPYGYDEAT